jgi:hypothetical protein
MSYTVQMGGLWATCPSALDVLTDGERSRSASATAAENTQDFMIFAAPASWPVLCFSSDRCASGATSETLGRRYFSAVGPDGFAARQRKVLLTSLFGADYGNFS